MSSLRIHESTLADHGLTEGDDYTLGAPDVALLFEALNRHAEFLDECKYKIEEVPGGQSLALSLAMKASRCRELRDIIDLGFETVVRGVGS